MNKVMGDKDIFWMDSYWNTKVEHDAWSFTPQVYPEIDYIQIATWSVIQKVPVVRENLASKLPLDKKGIKIIYQVDYVDPWYYYALS